MTFSSPLSSKVKCVSFGSPPTLLAAAILTLVGIVSGMLPAVKAARLDPIEALRYE